MTELVATPPKGRPELQSMGLQVVTIVSGTETPVGDGITGPIRCLVRLPDQSVRPAIVKTLSPQGVTAEVFCALLLRGWGLSVPEPAIIASPLAFASMDVTYPNLNQRIGWSALLPPAVQAALEARAATLVAQFAETPQALAADEAICNRDRNLGNILWDGQNVAWIDHERSLGVVPMQDLNKLALMAQSSTNAQNVLSAAVAFAMTLAPQVVKDAEAECSPHVDAAAFVISVNTKLRGLAAAVLGRFPQPPGGLFQVAP
jgi:hypothetical protein